MLELQCMCSPDPSGMLCRVQRLVFKFRVGIDAVGVGASYLFSIWTDYGNSALPHYQWLNPGNGSYVEQELPLADWKPHWGAITTSLRMDSSLSQGSGIASGEFQTFTVRYFIDIEYDCVDLVTGEHPDAPLVITAETHFSSEVKCYDSTVLRGMLTVDGSVMNAQFYKSRPVSGTCLSGAIEVSANPFSPDPNNFEEKLQLGSGGRNCLCATGGSGNYEYSIKQGRLPSGQTLNPETGCIDGDPDGTDPGTESIVYGVIDLGSGDTTIGAFYDIGGTINIFGTGISGISGVPLDSGELHVGDRIIISTFDALTGAPYENDRNLVSIGPGNNAVIDGVLPGGNTEFGSGIWSGVGWIHHVPITNTVGPPELAEVECGYIPPPCVEGGGLAGNWAL